MICGPAGGGIDRDPPDDRTGNKSQEGEIRAVGGAAWGVVRLADGRGRVWNGYQEAACGCRRRGTEDGLSCEVAVEDRKAEERFASNTDRCKPGSGEEECAGQQPEEVTWPRRGRFVV